MSCGKTSSGWTRRSRRNRHSRQKRPEIHAQVHGDALRRAGIAKG
jgi:hypothetical protein